MRAAIALALGALALPSCGPESPIPNPLLCSSPAPDATAACYLKLKYEALREGRIYLEMPDGERIKVVMEEKQ